MGYYGEPVYPNTAPMYGSCCPQPVFEPCCPPPMPVCPPVYPPPRHGSGFGVALVVVVVILLIILGAVYFYQSPKC